MDEDLRARIDRRRRALDRVRRILIEKLKVDREPDEIDPDVSLFGTGLHLDSVDAVELLVVLESELGVAIPDEIAAPARLRTVNTLVDLVLSHEVT